MACRGAMVMLWFGFDSLDQRNTIVPDLQGGWLSEIHLEAINNPRPELNPGVSAADCIAPISARNPPKRSIDWASA